MKYNNSILLPNENNGWTQSYRFRPSVSLILHLISGVDQHLIQIAQIYPRSLLRFIPWYSAKKGGGAITLGSANKTSITFTENFFPSSSNSFKNRDYSQNIHSWLRLASHEVIHLKHANQYRFLIIYLGVFTFQYLRYGHDKAPLEIEADIGSKRFDQFISFGYKNFKRDIIEEIFNSQMNEKERIILINKYWKSYLNN